MEHNFKGKVVMVTGGSAGIGEATAIMFAKCGAQLVIVGRDEACLNDVAKRCEKEQGQNALAIIADLATDEGVQKTVNATLKCFGRLDVLVNNAAMGAKATIQTTNMDIYDKVFALNVRGVYNLTRLLVPALIESKGNIINISSIVGSTASVGNLPYAMSKAAVDHFTRLIALELAPKGVRVNTVSPGVTKSKFFKRVTGATDEKEEEMMEAACQMIPMGEICIPDDIAATIVHLASDHSRLVTGALVAIDGGLQYNYRSLLRQVD